MSLEKQLIELRNNNNTISRNYYLFNILSGEKHEVRASYEDLCKLVQYLIKCKYYNDQQVSDDDFITNTTKSVEKYSLTISDKQSNKAKPNKARGNRKTKKDMDDNKDNVIIPTKIHTLFSDMLNNPNMRNRILPGMESDNTNNKKVIKATARKAVI